MGRAGRHRLFAGDGTRGFQDFAGPEVSPSAASTFFEQSGRWIDGEGMCRDLEHGEIVKGVAEDRVGMGKADAAKCFGFSAVSGDIDEVGGNDVFGDSDFGGKDALLGNAEVAHAFGDDPLVGGTHGPKLDVAIDQFPDERVDFREDVGTDMFGEEASGGGAQLLLAQAGIDLDHFAADLRFADGAGKVGTIAGVHPVGGGAGDKSLFNGPDHESMARVAAPEGPVTVEDSDCGCGLGNEVFELLRCPAGDFKLRR